MCDTNSIIDPIRRLGVILYIVGIEIPVCCAILMPTIGIGCPILLASMPIDYIINGDIRFVKNTSDDVCDYIEETLNEIGEIRRKYIYDGRRRF